MSGDMMQALSGSSLLSLSFGTLPAVKAGMNLDANPFASQLALMTGPDAAPGNGAAPVAATDGHFALALGDAGEVATVPATLAGQAASAPFMPPLPGASAIAAPQAVAPATPSPASAPQNDAIVALPDDATTSQLLEAVLGGAAAPKVATAAAPAALTPSGQPVAPAAAKAMIADPDADDAPRIESQMISQGEASADEPGIAELQGQRPRRATRVTETAPVVLADPVIVAPAIAPVALPTAVLPDAPTPESGTTRIAVSAAPAPIAAAPFETPAQMPEDSQPLSTAQPMSEPAPATSRAQPEVASSAAPRATVAAPLNAGLSQGSATPADVSVPLSAPVAVTPGQQIDPAEQTAFRERLPMTTGPVTSSPVVAPAAPVAVADVAPMASTGVAPEHIAPVIADTPPAASPLTVLASQAQAAAGVSPQLHTAPVPDAAPMAAAASPAVAPDAIAEPVPAATPGATAAAAAAFQASPATLRTASPAPRAPLGATLQRTVQAAAQSLQPAQALAAMLNLDDAAAEAAPLDAIGEAAPSLRSEAVQPSWVSALNAVTSAAASPGNAVQAVTAAFASAAPAQAPLETVAFDAGFIGNIETQISRVANGGQMVRMQIMPEHLGRIDIEMLAGPDRDQIRLVTENDTVRDTLVQSQVRLEQDLRQNGQRQTDVTVELRQQSTGAQGGSAQQQQPRGQGGTDPSFQRDTLQRQQAAADSETATPAQRRPRDNVRYA